MALPMVLLAACGKASRETVTSKEPASTAAGEVLKGGSHQQRLPATHFMRGKYTGSIRLDPSGSDAEETNEERVRAGALVARLQGGRSSASQARDIMTEARQLETAAVLKVAESLLKDHPDEDVRAEALILADGATTRAALPLLWQGMQDQSPDIRALAMDTARQVSDPAVAQLVEAGLTDPSEAVRQFALQAGANQDGQIRDDAILKGLASPHADLSLAALAEAEATPSKSVVPHVMNALGHQSAEVRESAHEMLFLLLGESFGSPQQAQAWWFSNQGKFDEDLVLADLERIEKLAAQSAAALQPQ